MRFILYSPIAFEKWDWRNSVEKGIGGSETSHVEMAWRLARRGHEVITYAPIPDDCPGEWRGTTWKPIEEVDWSQNGVWILYRCPEALDNFTDPHPGKILWLMNQDWDYKTLVGERLAKLDKMLILCRWHERYTLRNHPELAGKIMLTSNGLKADLLAEIAQEKIERNPYRIMFASSPDRGLKNLCKIFARAREFEPRLELHAFYGFNNLRKMKQATWLQKEADEIEELQKEADEIEELMKQPGITFHGRVSQHQLYREWLKSGLWVYPTSFHETSCITCMEAQAMGAIPIFSPVAALEENVPFGTPIEGDPNDPLTRARFAAEIVRWANPERQAQVRPEMMADALARFDWERFVDTWLSELEAPRFLNGGHVEAHA